MSAQAAAALRIANRVRLARAALRAEVRGLPAAEGLALLAAGFEDALWCAAGPAASERVAAVLDWLGDGWTGEVLEVIGASEFRRVDELTDRQRELAARLLREGAEGA